MKSITFILACAAIAITLTTACQKKGEVVHYQIEKSTPPKQQSLKVTETPSAPYSWTLPEGWTDKPASGMRLATILIPASGNTLNASITEFGGDLAGNVNRWRKQVGLPDMSEAEVTSSLEKIDTGLGQGYIVVLINPATPGNAMLATIIPRPSGTSLFVKVTGTADELKAIGAPFRKFTQSIKQ
jgi:hypothetical protein